MSLEKDTLALLRKYDPKDEYVNIGKSRWEGGTGVLNIVMRDKDLAALDTVMAECHRKCNCLFLFHSPCRGILPFTDTNPFEFMYIVHDMQLGRQNVNGIPRMISVHQHHGGSDHCLMVFQNLMVQELLVQEPGSISVGVASEATKAIEGIMSRKG